MSKKLVFLVSTMLTVAILAGCSKVVKDNTIKTIQLSPNVQGTPMVVELEVASKKVMGQAKGKTLSKSSLEKEAVAEVLKQTNGDVLVGANFFYEYGKRYLTVTVVGYPAFYKNFRPKKTSCQKETVLVGDNFLYGDSSKGKASAPVTVKNSVNIETTKNPVVDINTKIEILPVTADLIVSKQKTRGEAIGKISDFNLLVKEALAKALDQELPSVDKPDVLVELNEFTEGSGTKFKVILTGYPAYYTNFHTATETDSLCLNKTNSATSVVNESEK